MSRWHKNEWDFLPAEAFKPRGWKSGMTLEGGGGGGPSPTTDPNIGLAQQKLADLSTEQWNTFKSDIYPELLRQSKVQEGQASEQWNMDKKISSFNLDQAQKATERYEQGAIPAMEALKSDANKYNEAGYQEQLAGQAVGDINQSFDQQRQNEAMRQRSMGINPNSGAALNMGNVNSVQQAIASAQAATQTREAAHQIGLQKQGNVYNMYAGLPAQANMNTTTAMNASSQGMAGTGQALAGSSGVGGSLNAAAGTAMGGWNQVGGLGVGKYNADVSAYNARQQADATSSAGWGSAIGTLGAAYMTGGASLATKKLTG